MADRLPTELWVMARVRSLSATGVAAYVVRKGAPASGTVIVKSLARGQGCRLYNQTRDLEGRMAWMALYDGAFVDEAKADDYIARAVARDPDVWAVEIEHAEGLNPFADTAP